MKFCEVSRIGTLLETRRLKRALDDSIGLEDTEDDVEEPEPDKWEGRDPFRDFGSAELSVPEDGKEPPGDEKRDGQNSAASVDDDAEDQGVRGHQEPNLGVLKRNNYF